MSASFKATMGIAALTAVGGMTALISTHLYQGQSPMHHCHGNKVCTAFRENMNLKTSGSVYNVDKDSVVVDEANSQVTANLLLQGDDATLAQQLSLTLDFFADGIVGAYLTEDGTEFRISQEGLPVESDIPRAEPHFKTYDDRLEVSNLMSTTGDEGFAYTVEYDSFRIIQMAADGSVTMIVNDQDTLYYESNAQAVEEEVVPSRIPFWSSIVDLRDFFLPQRPKEIAVTEGIGLGAWVPSDSLFGLGEREDTLVLKKTTNSEPYELWATDAPHMPNKMTTLYGQLPFVTGISKTAAQAFAWINSAHTWVFLDDATTSDTAATEVNFVSESGALEFFIFASSVKTTDGTLNRNKRIQQKLRTVSGAAFLPPLHTLGFHFSKYAPASDDIIRQRNADFSKYDFPLDVIWMDIQWADFDSEDAGYMYFQFNPQNFTSDGLALMNQEVEDAGRYMTVILDPHIKHDASYFVYEEGEEEQEEEFKEDGTLVNIFVKDANEDADFVGDCWPGESVWVDFLNENAQQFWGNLYSYDKFIGSTSRYHAWNDMNEPSVFSEETKTIPALARHFKADGRTIFHRDFHNAYGALQQRSSFRGILARDNYSLRPFVLTRSFFLGSHKFGAYWTGDNYAVDSEVYGSMKMILQNSVAGAIFGGSDVPGFIGTPSDELYIRFYQLGSWEPFFRAHCDINSQDREPWIQSQRVQDAIRASINSRYDFIHYLYTTHWQATQTGEPIMRTMWNEFPDNESMFQVASQFMLGDNLLIAPKIDTPSSDQDSRQVQQVTFNLPAEAQWFNYTTKKMEYMLGMDRTVELSDLEQAVFVKGGAVLPKLLHDGCLALTQCIDEPIKLEVYQNIYGQASGNLYLDDGTSLDYQDGQSELITFSWMNSRLTASGAASAYSSGKVINEVEIYGFGIGPLAVTNEGHDVEWSFDDFSGILSITLPSVPIREVDISVVMRC